MFQSVWFNGIYFTRLSVLLFIRRLVTVCPSPRPRIVCKIIPPTLTPCSERHHHDLDCRRPVNTSALHFLLYLYLPVPSLLVSLPATYILHKLTFHRALWNRSIPHKCITLITARRIVFVHSGFGIFCDIALFVVPMVFAWRNLPTDGVRFRVTLLLSLGPYPPPPTKSPRFRF